MTLIAALIRPTEAVVIADSIACYGHGGEVVADEHGVPVEDRKLLQCGDFVLTGLGRLDLRTRAATAAKAMMSIDQAVIELPAILRAAAAALGEVTGADAPPGRGGNTIVAVGHSPSKGHMLLAVFQAQADFEPELYEADRPGCSVFWRNPAGPDVRSPITRDELLAWAPVCVQDIRTSDPMAPVGGLLQIADITKDTTMLSFGQSLGLPALALSAALTACGGGEPEYADQIYPQAATYAFINAPADGSVTDNVGGLDTAVEISNSGVYTNPTSHNVTVQVEADFLAWYTTTGTPSIGIAQIFMDLYKNGTPAGAVYSRSTPGVITTTTTTRYTFIVAIVLAPGDSVQSQLGADADAGGGSGSVVVHWSKVSHRLSVIKK